MFHVTKYLPWRLFVKIKIYEIFDINILEQNSPVGPYNATWILFQNAFCAENIEKSVWLYQQIFNSNKTKV